MTNNEEREAFENWSKGKRVCLSRIGNTYTSTGAKYFSAFNAGIEYARAQSSGVPDEIDICTNSNTEYACGWNACRTAMLADTPTPPKSASVPVEVTEDDVVYAAKAMCNANDKRLGVSPGYGWGAYGEQYLEQARVALSTVASRDREDAERYRWLRGHSIFCNDSMHEIWFDKSNDRGDVEGFDAAIDAARRGNKS